ncbi:MAG: transporter substrate-binding domain-containing protein [Spirochaetales bacterium]|nr:transporter substrate-binding domain-containing protein [Spirochaetales bacterium]
MTDQPLVAGQQFRGIAVDRVRCIFEKMDIELEIHVVPWERAQHMVQTGEADGFFAASQNLERDSFAVKSGIIAEQDWNWYLLKENPLNPDDPEFRQKARVGGFFGSNMLKWMISQEYNVTAVPHTTELLYQMLLAGRVDAVLANSQVMENIIKKNLGEDKIQVFHNLDKPLMVYFSKDFLKRYPAFLEVFNSYIEACYNQKEN